MINKEKSFDILFGSHISEKSSIIMKKSNVLTIKVKRKCTKDQIKKSIKKIFNVNVIKINTLIVKKKLTNNKNKRTKYSKWKKAYITLSKNQNKDFMNITN
ncbi:50S ribosomal protein L23 [Buchnera aphidicola (Taiwanaphis decaspermi)]|uniref:50S ribosomal protein L23 n=1 Tax=Buchnera aphidicola TaxID=9 RepID=UPI0031B8AE72